ncbi:helicase-related protein [Ensifer soli]|uniref:helicase-related protein n=1 Tax=Ciceribacter sp. sgz301302 TaxID=3342379 RepID=UPI0035B77C6E
MHQPTLRDDQIADLAFYMANDRCLNLSDAGAGKTPSVCVMQWYLWSELRIGTVWAMPKSLLKKNRRELLRFTGFGDEDVVIVDGTPAEIARQLGLPAKVFLMGFRRLTLSWRNLPAHVTAVHVDEMHMGYKGAGSQQSAALFALFDSGRMTHFLGMTGTLIDGKLSSAYPAVRIIDAGSYPSPQAFDDEHAVFDLDGRIAGWKNHNRLARILGRHAIRRSFASIHGEQEVVHIPEPVDMEERQRGLYDRFHHDAVLELERFTIDGTRPGVAFTRARQLMEHPGAFPDLSAPGRFIDILEGEPTAKEERLKIHLEEHHLNGKPLIVFTSMLPQQGRIARLLQQHGLTFALISGGISRKARDAASDAFIDGRVQVMLATERTASFGYNWQVSGGREVDHMIFATLGFSDASFVQARQRAIRGRRKSPLRVTTLEYISSIDQHICRIVHRKSLEAHRVDPSRPVLQLSGCNDAHHPAHATGDIP